tara:strand:- start:2635 stop:2886 length:252 start_codon:yes stop_codon:yes gene_type:complete
MTVLKILAPEINLASATNVGFASLVRVLNNKTSVQLLTHTDAAGQVLGTVTLAAGEIAYVKKNPTDKLLGAATSLSVSVAFAN